MKKNRYRITLSKQTPTMFKINGIMNIYNETHQINAICNAKFCRKIKST